MSFDEVFESYSRIRRHLDETEFRVSYPKIHKKLGRAKELFREWLDIYEEYAKGYSQELLTLTDIAVIRMLSLNGVMLEEKFSEIHDAKISPEIYIVIDDMFSNLGHEDILYVVAQWSSFGNSTIYKDVERAIRGLSPPMRTSSRIDVLKTNIKSKDTLLLYYERGQYDNPLAWPLLLHEGFHHIYSTERLYQVEDKCANEPWLPEVLIDMYATNFFGPAYAASSAIYLKKFPHSEAVSHPHFVARLYSSLLYLTRLMNEDDLPILFKEHVNQTFDYVKNVWDKYKHQAPEVQKIEEINNIAEQSVIKTISRKTKTFLDLLLTTEDERLKAYKLSAEDYLEKEVLSIEDVLEFYKQGIPVAVNPRILFNSFISRNFLQGRISKTFITESLKKWHIKKTWSEAI
jgi:hypothetical protein